MIKIVTVSDRYLPVYKTEGAACADVFARLEHSVNLKPNTRILVPLGFSIELMSGWELQVRGRSGHANKHGIMITNGIGTIDSDFRGEVSVLLYNSGEQEFALYDGLSVAQVCIQPTHKIEWQIVSSLENTVRGNKGFGSTSERLIDEK